MTATTIYKRPEKLVILERSQRNPVGNVLKQALREHPSREGT
jgi:hypothetical protein